MGCVDRNHLVKFQKGNSGISPQFCDCLRGERSRETSQDAAIDVVDSALALTGYVIGHKYGTAGGTLAGEEANRPLPDEARRYSVGGYHPSCSLGQGTGQGTGQASAPTSGQRWLTPIEAKKAPQSARSAKSGAPPSILDHPLLLSLTLYPDSLGLSSTWGRFRIPESPVFTIPPLAENAWQGEAVAG